jgi:hypothetical protein
MELARSLGQVDTFLDDPRDAPAGGPSSAGSSTR